MSEACDCRWTWWFRMRGQEPPSFGNLPPMTEEERANRQRIMDREGLMFGDGLIGHGIEA